VLTDQQGDYLYVVDSGNKVQQRRVQLGPSTAGNVAVTGGLSDGEQVVVEGIQRIRPGQIVSPGAPASAEGAPGSPTPG
jgi:membrane fusion protein (multidrug efflux system)